MKIQIKRTKSGIKLGREIKDLELLKKYRVSGFLEEVGAVQGDFEATSKEEAIRLADFDKVVNVSEI